MAPFTSTEIRGLRILLADDEIFIREMGSDVQTMLGCKPTVAADGRETWEFFQKDPNGFDVITSDYNMPEMTGIDLASCVMSIKPNMPFIISSGFAEKQAEDLGISCILPKPYVIQQLKDAITEARTNAANA